MKIGSVERCMMIKRIQIVPQSNSGRGRGGTKWWCGSEYNAGTHKKKERREEGAGPLRYHQYLSLLNILYLQLLSTSIHPFTTMGFVCLVSSNPKLSFVIKKNPSSGMVMRKYVNLSIPLQPLHPSYTLNHTNLIKSSP